MEITFLFQALLSFFPPLLHAHVFPSFRCIALASSSLGLSFFFFAMSLVLQLLCKCVRVCVSECVQCGGCQEGVETHRWSGWFPLSEIWVRAHSQISGPHS